MQYASRYVLNESTFGFIGEQKKGLIVGFLGGTRSVFYNGDGDFAYWHGFPGAVGDVQCDEFLKGARRHGWKNATFVFSSRNPQICIFNSFLKKQKIICFFKGLRERSTAAGSGVPSSTSESVVLLLLSHPQKPKTYLI